MRLNIKPLLFFLPSYFLTLYHEESSAVANRASPIKARPYFKALSSVSGGHLIRRSQRGRVALLSGPSWPQEKILQPDWQRRGKGEGKASQWEINKRTTTNYRMDRLGFKVKPDWRVVRRSCIERDERDVGWREWDEVCVSDAQRTCRICGSVIKGGMLFVFNRVCAHSDKRLQVDDALSVQSNSRRLNNMSPFRPVDWLNCGLSSNPILVFWKHANGFHIRTRTQRIHAW